MATTTSLDRAHRQVLAMLGNQCVVFARSNALPQPLQFDPETDSPALPRVAHASEETEARIAETLRIAGLTSSFIGDRESSADVTFTDATGLRFSVDIKVRDHDPRTRDFDQSRAKLVEAAARGEAMEVWYFNRERLKITALYLDRGRVQFDELMPLDVWEKSEDGVFRRSYVAAEVDDWVKRIDALYSGVQDWLHERPDLRYERARTVTMSEELMQRFAVPDRELPILDVIAGDQPLVSFVPRGLWLIGSHGRVDIITRTGTQVLVAARDDQNSPLHWLLIAGSDRRDTRALTKELILSLVGAT